MESGLVIQANEISGITTKNLKGSWYKMTKDVVISIKGLQFEGDMDSDKIETITMGEYYEKNGGHYIIYDEVKEGFAQETKSIIHLKGKELNITKRGLINVHMVFEEHKKNMTSYMTPYGSVLIGVDTKKVTLVEKKEEMQVLVDYALEINYEHLADCKIMMDIRSKEACGITLQ